MIPLLEHASDGSVKLNVLRQTVRQRFTSYVQQMKARGWYYDPLLGVAMLATEFAASVGVLLFAHGWVSKVASIFASLTGVLLLFGVGRIVQFSLGLTRGHRWLRERAWFVFSPASVREKFPGGDEPDRSWAWVLRARENAFGLSIRFVQPRWADISVARSIASPVAYQRLVALLVEHKKLAAPFVGRPSDSHDDTTKVVVREARRAPSDQRLN